MNLWVALALVSVGIVLPIFGRRIRSRWRFTRAAAAEERAVQLAKRSGYRVVGVQVPTTLMVRVDGKPIDVELRADMIVERGFRRFVGEVKSGKVAPDPMSRATRRQLLEYGFAFDADGILLFDMEEDQIHEIRFDRRFQVGQAIERLLGLLSLIGAGALLESTFHLLGALG